MIRYRVIELEYKLPINEMIKLYENKELVQNIELVNDEFINKRYKSFNIRELIFTYDYRLLLII